LVKVNKHEINTGMIVCEGKFNEGTFS
jgi:hypothetical protein